MTMPINLAVKKWLLTNGYVTKTGAPDDSVFREAAAKAMVAKKLSTEKYSSLLEDTTMADSPDPEKVLGGNGSTITVKRPSEFYNDTKHVGTHVKTGQPVLNEKGQPQTIPTQLNHAKWGVYIKRLAAQQGVSCQLSEHEKNLWGEMCSEDVFAGDVGGQYFSHIKDCDTGHIKALLDGGGASGGLEIAPIHFDDDVVSTPQLSGELYPFVGKKDISRGRRVEGASIGQITINSGGGDAQSITVFNTDALIAAIDTTIFVADCAIEIGRDFLSDAAVDVGRLVQSEMSSSFKAWLDEVIAVGSGTDEPEGVMTASGTTSVAFSGATSIGNYESLLFSVPKAQRGSVTAPGTRFCATETTYQRAKATPISATDDRRIHGMSHEDFRMLSRPYSISTAMSNQQAFFGDLARGYRFYRRVGMSFQVETGGDYLARSNQALIIGRMRVGGRVVLGSSFGTVTDAPA